MQIKVKRHASYVYLVEDMTANTILGHDDHLEETDDDTLYDVCRTILVSSPLNEQTIWSNYIFLWKR